MQINSPLFTSLQLEPAVSASQGEPQLVPTLPDKPTAATSTVQLYIIPTEKTLFLQGFDPAEYSDQAPVLLRGCLFIRILKPSKIKSISLSFRGKQRTDWPEGIPPKRNVFHEELDIMTHTWPFYSQSNPLNAINGGADFYSEAKSLDRDVSTLNLAETHNRGHSASMGEVAGNNSFLLRSLSPAANLIKRSGTSPALTPVDSFTDLQSVNTNPDSESGKPGNFPPGDYIYNFEHPLRPSLPETTSVTFGEVSYELEATIIRAGAFKANVVGKMPIILVRTPSDANQEENEPIMITRDWEDQLRYDIVIGGKSLVLDSYLPLAFRFVPLWGKVALHRIRVYLSENLEYYCLNKKVHRMEPSKKYLLLEHKAQKGKSLLAKKHGQDYGSESDEVLPRELEFQLYVPQTMNGRMHHALHPDTSFDNIQAHHWIKICLRISKTDPEIEGKRKHYEIAIDSPIHVLSPLAAHGNTLLPAYDDHILNPDFLPEYSPASPPLSPEVIPVDNTQSIGRLFSNLTSISSNTAHHTVTNPTQPPDPANHGHFYHLNSSSNNDEPIERETDMHLDANLYKPDPEDSRSQLNSPQALPHPGNFSPVASPMSRPIHMLRRPSFNPPPFDADIAPAGLDAPPPPAYDEELSPLRIDEAVSGNIDDARIMTGSSSDSQAPRTPTSSVAPPMSNQISIKDLLTNSFGSVDRKNSVNSLRSQGSAFNNERNSLYSNRSSTMSQSSRDRNPSITRRSRTSVDRQSKAAGGKSQESLDVPNSESLPKSSEGHKVKENEKDRLQDDGGEDIVNLMPPELIPPSVSPRRPLSPIASPAKPRLLADRDVSPLRRLSDDMQDMSATQSSRRASLTSAFSSDLPMGQNIPLLNQSAVSLNTLNVPGSGRTASVSSLLMDTSRTISNTNSTKIMDFVDGGDLSSDYNRLNNNLLTLRNPRLKKHYHETGEIEDPIQENPPRKENSDHSNASNSSYETIYEPSGVHGRKVLQVASDETVEGIKFRYAVD